MSAATRVAEAHCFPVKSMGGEQAACVEVTADGIRGDREWAVYGIDGKLASGKHSRRFRRMDPVFALVARRVGGQTLVRLPGGTELVAGHENSDALLSEHFGEPVALRREAEVMHQDQAPLSLVGTATLAELGRHEGDGRPVDPRHLRANLVVTTTEPYAEESWVGREVSVGAVRVRVLEATQRCRMVSIGQVGLVARPGLLKTVTAVHNLCAGVYATVLRPGEIAVGDDLSAG